VNKTPPSPSFPKGERLKMRGKRGKEGPSIRFRFPLPLLSTIAL